MVGGLCTRKYSLISGTFSRNTKNSDFCVVAVYQDLEKTSVSNRLGVVSNGEFDFVRFRCKFSCAARLRPG